MYTMSLIGACKYAFVRSSWTIPYCRNAVTKIKMRNCIWLETGLVVSVYVSSCCLFPLITTLFFALISLLMSYR